MSELLPCPFCGSGDVGGGSGVVHCYTCKLHTRLCRSTAEAGEAWNRRAARCNDTAPVAPIGDAPTFFAVGTTERGSAINSAMQRADQSGFTRGEFKWCSVFADELLAAVAAPISDAQIEAGVEAWFSTYGNDFHARMRSALAAVAAQGGI